MLVYVSGDTSCKSVAAECADKALNVERDPMSQGDL
jgi:hypothetical protein